MKPLTLTQRLDAAWPAQKALNDRWARNAFAEMRGALVALADRNKWEPVALGTVIAAYEQCITGTTKEQAAALLAEAAQLETPAAHE